MRTTGPIDKTERDNWNADVNRRAKLWLIWTLLLLVVAYLVPLRWAVLLAVLYARVADPDLRFAFSRSVFLLRPEQRKKTIYTTSVVLKDESSGDTRARLHILENGEPPLSLYGASGEETAVFTTNAEDEPEDAKETLLKVQSRIDVLEENLKELEVLHGLSHDSRVREQSSPISTGGDLPFKAGMTFEEFKAAVKDYQKDAYGTYRVSRPPVPYDKFDTYTVLISNKVGLVSVRAGWSFESNRSGE